jgi:hypothetical protein
VIEDLDVGRRHQDRQLAAGRIEAGNMPRDLVIDLIDQLAVAPSVITIRYIFPTSSTAEHPKSVFLFSCRTHPGRVYCIAIVVSIEYFFVREVVRVYDDFG